MVASINSKDNFTVTGPAGWVLIGRTPNTTGSQLTTFYKVATAVEGATYTFTVNGSALDATAAIQTFISADNNAPVQDFTSATGSGTTRDSDERGARADGRRHGRRARLGQRADSLGRRRVHDSVLAAGRRSAANGSALIVGNAGNNTVDVGHMSATPSGRRMRSR